jgi:hypothetical protein
VNLLGDKICTIKKNTVTQIGASKEVGIEINAEKIKCMLLSQTIILPVVLYGCETWSLTLREEHRLRVFENRVLRRIFERKRDEEKKEKCVMRKRVRRAGHVARMG